MSSFRDVLGTLAMALTISCASSADRVPPGKAGECAQCHLPDFQAARNHPQKKPTTCGVCHGQAAWHPQFLDHPWHLTGAHLKADCFACHQGDPPKFHGIKHHCIDCHRKDYQDAAHHQDLQTTCDDCHSTKKWKGAKWPEKSPEPPVLPPPEPSASVPPQPSASVPPKPTATWKPKPTPTTKPTTTPTTKPTTTPTTKPTTTPTTKPTLDPDIITHPSGPH